MVQAYLGENRDGLELYDKALGIYRSKNLNDPALLVEILINIGTVHLQKGDYEAADASFVEVTEIARQNAASKAPMAMLLSNHAGVLKNLDRQDEATAKYVEAISLLTRSLGIEHPETITALTSLANHYRQIGDMQMASETIRQAIAAADVGLPPVNFIRSYVGNIGAGILCLGEDVSLGSQLASSSLNIRRELLPPDHWAIASGEGVLGMCLAAAGDYEEAEPVLLRAYAELQASLGDTHEVTLTNKGRIIQMYTAWGKLEQAAQYGPPDP